MHDDPLIRSAGKGHGGEPFRERRRLAVFEAMAEVVSERGLGGTSAAAVAKRARVSRTTLAAQFGDVEACLVELMDCMLESVTALIRGAFERETSWQGGVIGGLEATLELFEAHPFCARACLLESMPGPPSGMERRAEALAALGLLIDAQARKGLSPERQPPAVISEAATGSVLAILRRGLMRGEVPPYLGLLGPLAGAVVAPYRGPSAAARVAGEGQERAEALLAGRDEVSPPWDVEIPSMLRDSRAHRMRSCIRYLAENPGASNKAVAAAIGVDHPGQVSELLSRLQRAGLLVKERGEAGKPNALSLSAHGTEVSRALFGA